jgi:hypothetical protein
MSPKYCTVGYIHTDRSHSNQKTSHVQYVVSSCTSLGTSTECTYFSLCLRSLPINSSRLICAGILPRCSARPRLQASHRLKSTLVVACKKAPDSGDISIRTLLCSKAKKRATVLFKSIRNRPTHSDSLFLDPFKVSVIIS